MRKKWKNACKLVLHTNSLTTKTEKDEEEVFGMHTRPARLAPKIQVEEVDDEEADTLEEHEEESGVETLSGNNGGGWKGRCRLTLHCGEDDQEVTPGALLSISLKKQGQASKSRRLSDCLLHQVLITNLVHQAEDQALSFQPARFCCPGQQEPTERIRRRCREVSGSPSASPSRCHIPTSKLSSCQKIETFCKLLVLRRKIRNARFLMSKHYVLYIFIISFCVIFFGNYLLARELVVNRGNSQQCQSWTFYILFIQSYCPISLFLICICYFHLYLVACFSVDFYHLSVSPSD